MRICRTIFALLVALSVATLPMAGAMAASAGPAGDSADVAMEAMGQSPATEAATDDCCPPSKAPCGMPVDQCPAYSCAQPVAFSAAAAVHVTHPLVPRTRLAALSDSGFRPQPSSPPLRPPRI